MDVRFYVLFDYPNTPPPTLVRIIDVPPYTIKFHCQNEVVLGGLLQLAAFLQPTDDPYEWPGSLMELW